MIIAREPYSGEHEAIRQPGDPVHPAIARGSVLTARRDGKVIGWAQFVVTGGEPCWLALESRSSFATLTLLGEIEEEARKTGYPPGYVVRADNPRVAAILSRCADWARVADVFLRKVA